MSERQYVKSDTLFDACLHPAGLNDQDLQTLALFGVKGAVAVSWTLSATAKSIRAHFDDLLEKQLPRLRRAGIRGYAALGVHPAGLPRRGLSEVLASLPGYCRAGQVVAIGALGLREGNSSEEQALLEQLDVAKTLKLRALVAVPREGHESALKKTLWALKKSGLPERRAALLGVDGKGLTAVRERGHHATLLLHPDYLSVEAAVGLLKKQGSERVMLGSACGRTASDFLALARAQSVMEKQKVSAHFAAHVLADNAAAFFKVHV